MQTLFYDNFVALIGVVIIQSVGEGDPTSSDESVCHKAISQDGRHDTW